MAETTDSFRHLNSLDRDKLRLLQPTTVTSDRISFDIVEIPRDDATEYTAVSYAWGDEEPLDVIYLNGLPFLVRPNLWSCLYHLSRYQKKTTEWRYIWVDAVCINQMDDIEKSHQVHSMDLTFSKARWVSVWLGLPMGVTVHAPSSRHQGSPHGSSLVPGLGVGANWSEDIHDLAERPYWKRTWIIQELVLSTRVRFFCGANNASWDTFQKTLSFYEGHGWVERRTAAQGLMTDTSLKRYGHRGDEYGREGTFTLASLLFSHRHSQCRDPRDRVFALLGIASDVEDLKDVFPDYTLSEEQVAVITLAHILDGQIFRDYQEALFWALGLAHASVEYRQDLLKQARQLKLKRAKRKELCQQVNSATTTADHHSPIREIREEHKYEPSHGRSVPQESQPPQEPQQSQPPRQHRKRRPLLDEFKRFVQITRNRDKA